MILQTCKSLRLRLRCCIVSWKNFLPGYTSVGWFWYLIRLHQMRPEFCNSWIWWIWWMTFRRFAKASAWNITCGPEGSFSSGLIILTNGERCWGLLWPCMMTSLLSSTNLTASCHFWREVVFFSDVISFRDSLWYSNISFVIITVGLRISVYVISWWLLDISFRDNLQYLRISVSW